MSEFEKKLHDGILREEFDENLGFSLNSNFPMMNKKADQLKIIFEKYTFHSLAIAIFTINAWRNNRSTQESCLALNKAFILLEHEGNKGIRCFADFRQFYNEVEVIGSVTTNG